jgi:hypothetical protein
MESPHRIRTQRWQVKASSTAEAFAWRTMLHVNGQDLLSSVFEEACAGAVTADSVVHIPRIELSLAVSSMDELRERLPQAARDEVRRLFLSLDEKRVSPDTRPKPESPGQCPLVKDSGLSGATFDFLVQYLRTGLLPWPMASPRDGAEPAKLAEILGRELPRLRETLKRTPEGADFYFRLLQLAMATDDRTLSQVVAAVMPLEVDSAVDRCLALMKNPAESSLSTYGMLRLVACVLAAGRNWKGTGRLTDMEGFEDLESLPGHVAAVLHTIFKEWAAPDSRESDGAAYQPASPFADNVSLRGDPSPAPECRPIETNPLSGSGDGFLQAVLRNLATSDAYAQENSDGPGWVAPQAASPMAEGASLTGFISPEAGRRIMYSLFPLLVRQAGLILLHPFFPRLFRSCNIVSEDGTAIRRSLLPKGAALIHHLATGREEVFEYDLGLIKVLLGLHPADPLPVSDGLLTRADRDEALVLLQSATAHWTALKNISADGLRSSFLLRDGLLREQEQGWLLTVERKGYDMLLDRIPWSIGIVRLPWMKKALFTQW